MMRRRYSLAEKKVFFEAWNHPWYGWEYYCNDNMPNRRWISPEREIISTYSNDEVLEKFFEARDSERGQESDPLTAPGWQLYCRFEMRRRIEEGIEKFEGRPPVPPAPNRKYTSEHFDRTTQYIGEGFGKGAAIQKTLEDFHFRFDRVESYRIQYNKYLKGPEVSSKRRK